MTMKAKISVMRKKLAAAARTAWRDESIKRKKVVFFLCFRESFGGFDQGAAIREFSQGFEVDESTKEGGGVGAGRIVWSVMDIGV
jgi:hypothetical protein